MEASFSIVQLVIAFIAVLSIAAIILAFSNRYGIPYTVALVVLGASIGHIHIYGPESVHSFLTVDISPNLIFYVCLPTLIFESAFNLDGKRLKQNMFAILTLAIPGLLISTFIIGFIILIATGIAFVYCLLLGAILSATDPVAVISIFKKLGAPKRLTILVEGESLFNDATAIVTSKILLTIILSGVFTSHQVWHGVADFFVEFIGGLAVGGIMAMIVGYFLGKVENNREIEISLTTILAYATFVIAQDYFHVSGVTATVAAGLMISVWGHTKISPEVVTFMYRFWEFMAYFANAIIFLLVGISVNLASIIQNSWAILAVIVAMLISRAIVIYGLVPLVRKILKQPNIDLSYQTVMYWGGLRGAIALGIILSLEKFQYTELFTTLVLGAVLFTLLVQGLTIKNLVRMLGLVVPPLSEQLLRLESTLRIRENAIRKVTELQKLGMFCESVADKTYQQFLENKKRIEKEIALLKEKKIDPLEEEKYLYLDCLGIERSSYYKLFTKGHFTTKTYRRLIDKVELRNDAIRSGNTDPKAIDLIRKRKPWVKKLIKFIDKFPIFNPWCLKFQTGRVALNYKIAWALQQGSQAVLNHIQVIEKTGRKNKEIVNKVKNYFTYWRDASKERLDIISEQFPEFVIEMQSRLAERLKLYAVIDGLDQQAIAGFLPSSLAKEMKKDVINQIRSLKEKADTAITLTSYDSYKKNTILSDLPEHEFNLITNRLQVTIVPLGELIIKQNEISHSIYFINRGVVRLSRETNGKEEDIATLLAGDYFGLMTEQQRAAYPVHCRTVTPCAIARLRHKDYDRLKSSCPVFVKKIEEAIQERRLITKTRTLG